MLHLSFSKPVSHGLHTGVQGLQPAIETVQLDIYSLQLALHSLQLDVYSDRDGIYSVEDDFHSIRGSIYSPQNGVYSLQNDACLPRRQLFVAHRSANRRNAAPSVALPRGSLSAAIAFRKVEGVQSRRRLKARTKLR